MSARSGTCAICGGRDFGPGPAGRLAVTGLPLCCRGCGSLERHRSLHHLLSLLPNAMLSWRRAMQFSPDPALRPAWFATHEISLYGGANNLDLQAIGRPLAQKEPEARPRIEGTGICKLPMRVGERAV